MSQISLTWKFLPQNIEEPVGVVISEKSSYKTSNAGARWVAVGISLTPDLNRTRKQVARLDASMVIAAGAKSHRVQSEQPCPVGMPNTA